MMRLPWRRDRAHGKFGRPLIEIDYASSDGGRLPVIYVMDGVTREDVVYIREWLKAMRSHGHSADAFIPRDL